MVERIGELAKVTSDTASRARSFGASTPVAVLRGFFRTSHSYGYAGREENALRTATDALSSETPVRHPG